MNEDEKALINAAIDWRARLADEDASAATHADFETWLDEDPRHRAAYAHAERFWRGLDALEKNDLDQALFKPSMGERLRAGVIEAGRRFAGSASGLLPLAGAGAAAASVLLFLNVYAPEPADDAPVETATQYAFETGIGEIRRVELEDGSVLTLGAGSMAQVRFSEVKRTVLLKGGDAFFDVARDVERPFEVTAGDMRARVLGTRFDVRLNHQSTDLAVAEGAVEVYYPRAPMAEDKASQSGARLPAVSFAKLGAGERVTGSAAAGLGEVAAIRPERVGVWRDKRLVYFDAPITEIIDDVNRYQSRKITIGDEGLADLKISAAFESDDVEGMLVTLSELFALNVEHAADGSILILPR